MNQPSPRQQTPPEEESGRYWKHVVDYGLIFFFGVPVLVVAVAAFLGLACLVEWESVCKVSSCGWSWLTTGEKEPESGSTTVRNLALSFGGFIAIGVAIWRSDVANRQAKALKQQVTALKDQVKISQSQATTSQQGLLNERYQKGAEMLGSSILSVRLGGIYALTRLAGDHAGQYHVQIIRLLSAFVRDRSAQQDNQSREDVQAAMTAIGTRSDADIKREKKEAFELDLTRANLTNTNLSNANLTDADLSGANLAGANLAGTNLTSAKLTSFDAKRRRPAEGLTQDQLNQACANSNKWPQLDAVQDAETGKLLKWRDQP